MRFVWALRYCAMKSYDSTGVLAAHSWANMVMQCDIERGMHVAQDQNTDGQCHLVV